MVDDMFVQSTSATCCPVPPRNMEGLASYTSSVHYMLEHRGCTRLIFADPACQRIGSQDSRLRRLNVVAPLDTDHPPTYIERIRHTPVRDDSDYILPETGPLFGVFVPVLCEWSLHWHQSPGGDTSSKPSALGRPVFRWIGGSVVRA